MIWIWLLFRNRQTWTTGPLDRFYTFFCTHCSVATPAMVRTVGYGTGSNVEIAQRRAFALAAAHAHRAGLAAACPHCSQLQPETIALFHKAQANAARRTKLAWPIAAVASLVVFVLCGALAVPDLRHSIGLGVVAVGVASGVFALALALFHTPARMPPDNPHGAWFSFDPSQGPSSWFPAQRGVAPTIVQPSRLARVLGFAAAGLGAATAITGGVVYSNSFRRVHVANATNDDIVVTIDGANVGRVAPFDPTRDIPSARYEVRTSAVHHVRLARASGDVELGTYDLDARTAKEGWVLAPRALEEGLCLTSITWFYGKAPKDTDEDHLLNGAGAGDRVELPKAFDYMFVQPPSTMQTDSGGTTRSSLRALHCGSLARGDVVRFADRPRRPVSVPDADVDADD